MKTAAQRSVNATNEKKKKNKKNKKNKKKKKKKKKKQCSPPPIAAASHEHAHSVIHSFILSAFASLLFA